MHLYCVKRRPVPLLVPCVLEDAFWNAFRKFSSGTRSRRRFLERVPEIVVGNAFSKTLSVTKIVSFLFHRLTIMFHAVPVTRHTSNKTVYYNSSPATMKKTTKGKKKSAAANLVSPTAAGSSTPQAALARSSKLLSNKKRNAKRTLDYDVLSPPPTSKRNKTSTPLTDSNGPSTTTTKETNPSTTTAKAKKVKEKDDNVFLFALDQDREVVRKALLDSRFNTDDLFVTALCVTFRSTLQFLSRLVYIIHTLIEQPVDDDDHADIDVLASYASVPADFSYQIRMFLKKGDDDAFELIALGKNLTNRLSNLGMPSKWNALRSTITSLGGKSVKFDTIVRYLRVYLMLVAWFVNHVKAPPRVDGRENCFHYDCTDQSVKNEETTKYMTNLVDFFKSLIPNTALRRMTKCLPSEEGLTLLLQRERAALVKDLNPKVIDMSECKDLVPCPKIPSPIPTALDVQRLYVRSVTSLWDKMQHPKLQVFENICLKHFRGDALLQPHFVESYLPMLALCSLLDAEGTVKVPFCQEVLYHLFIYKSELLPLYDVSVNLRRLESESEICLTRHKHETKVTKATKKITQSRTDAVFQLNIPRDVKGTDPFVYFLKILLMASIQVNFRELRQFDQVTALLSRILDCFGGKNEAKSLDSFGHKVICFMDNEEIDLEDRKNLEFFLKAADDILVSQRKKNSLLTFDTLPVAGHFFRSPKGEHKKVVSGTGDADLSYVFNSTLFVTTPQCATYYNEKFSCTNFYESVQSRAHAQNYPADRFPAVKNYVLKQQADVAFMKNVEKTLISSFSANHFRSIIFLFKTETEADNAFQSGHFFVRTLDILQKYYYFPVDAKIMIPLTNQILDWLVQGENKLREWSIEARFMLPLPENTDDRSEFEKVLFNFDDMNFDEENGKGPVNLDQIVDIFSNVGKEDFTNNSFEVDAQIRWLRLKRVESTSKAGIVLSTDHEVLKPKITYSGIGVGENLIIRPSDDYGVRLDMKESDITPEQQEQTTIYKNPRTLIFDGLKYPRFEMNELVYSCVTSNVGFVHGYGISVTGGPTYHIRFPAVEGIGTIEEYEYSNVEALHENGTLVYKQLDSDPITFLFAVVTKQARDDDDKFCYEVAVIEKQARDGDDKVCYEVSRDNEKEKWYQEDIFSNYNHEKEKKRNEASLKYLTSTVFERTPPPPPPPAEPPAEPLEEATGDTTGHPTDSILKDALTQLKEKLVEAALDDNEKKKIKRDLSDKLIGEIIKTAPTIKEKAHLVNVHGLGPVKIHDYGDEIWKVLQNP